MSSFLKLQLLAPWKLIRLVSLIVIVALDWLGMGLSSRPSPKVFETPAGVKDETVEARVARAENFFVDSLEAFVLFSRVEVSS